MFFVFWILLTLTFAKVFSQALYMHTCTHTHTYTHVNLVWPSWRLYDNCLLVIHQAIIAGKIELKMLLYIKFIKKSNAACKWVTVIYSYLHMLVHKLTFIWMCEIPIKMLLKSTYFALHSLLFTALLL